MFRCLAPQHAHKGLVILRDVSPEESLTYFAPTQHDRKKRRHSERQRDALSLTFLLVKSKKLLPKSCISLIVLTAEANCLCGV